MRRAFSVLIRGVQDEGVKRTRVILRTARDPCLHIRITGVIGAVQSGTQKKSCLFCRNRFRRGRRGALCGRRCTLRTAA